MTSLTNSAASAGTNVVSLTYSDANQIKTRSQSNVAFDVATPASFTTPYVSNGLNQMVSASGVGIVYDARGNLSSDGAVSYGYNAKNLLTSTARALR